MGKTKTGHWAFGPGKKKGRLRSLPQISRASPYLSSWVESWVSPSAHLFSSYYIGKSCSTSFSNLKFIFNHLSSKEYVQGMQKVLNANFGSSKIPNILVVSSFFFPFSYIIYFNFHLFYLPVISVFLKGYFTNETD